MAMMKPNNMLIVQVMLFSQGFISAELLSDNIMLSHNVGLDSTDVLNALRYEHTSEHTAPPSNGVACVRWPDY